VTNARMVVDAVSSYVNIGHSVAKSLPPFLNDTSTASVARAAPAFSFSIDNHSNTTGGYGIRLVSSLDRAEMVAGNHQILSLAGADLLFYDAVAGAFKSTDGTNVASVSHDIVADQEMILSVVYDAEVNTLEVGINGTYGTPAAYDDAFASGSALSLLSGASHTWWAGDLQRVGPI
jgi:hypothetical protein